MKVSTNHIGARIRELRERNGLSQTALGERLELSQGVVSRWELGKAEPADDQRTRLEEVLGPLGLSLADEASEMPPFSGWVSRKMGAANLTVAELARKAGVSYPTVLNVLNGRIANPQTRTRDAITAALGDVADGDQPPTSPPATKGVGQLIDFDPYDHSQLPDKLGIYVFYDVSQRPIYVGQSARISKRLKEHHEKFWFKAPIV